MAKVNGFKSEAPSTAFPMLPAGAYVCGIKNVKIDGQEPDQQLVIRLDIIEGDYSGYFTNRYNHDSQNGGKYEVKYKGDLRIQIPDERNTKRQHPEWDLRTLNTSVWCIEQSNPGYHWDGDTDHIGEMKGKIVGINVREGVYNGNPYTQIGRLEDVNAVRKGLVKPMKPKADSAPAAQDSGTSGGFTPVEVDELPF